MINSDEKFFPNATLEKKMSARENALLTFNRQEKNNMTRGKQIFTYWTFFVHLLHKDAPCLSVCLCMCEFLGHFRLKDPLKFFIPAKFSFNAD